MQHTIIFEIDALPHKLRQFRERVDLTLREVAELSGVSLSFISDIEHGRTKPSFETLGRLMAVYGYDYFIALQKHEG